MRICLIINTQDANAIDQLRQQVDRLRRSGNEVHPRLTFEEGDAYRMARSAATGAVDVVIAAGGDGTINEVANGLHAHLVELPEEARGAANAPRLGIIPLGTGNDLAAAVGIPTAIPDAVETAVGGSALIVDVGLVEGRCFLNVSTGGFGAEATEEASAEVKRALGPLAYVITGARKFASLEVSRARFTDTEPVYEGPFLLFAVGNGRRTGAGNWLTPRADLTDGLLDLCVVKEVSRMEFIKMLPELRAGNHLDHPAVIYRQVPRVVVESEQELSVNADGEPLSGRRFTYRLSPYRLRIMVPQGAG